MKTGKVKRIYPMQRALMILLDDSRKAPLRVRKAAWKTAILAHHLTLPPKPF